MSEYIREAVDQGKVTGPYAYQVLFSAIANSGEWAGQETISDGFYKELKVTRTGIAGLHLPHPTHITHNLILSTISTNKH